MRAVKGGFQCTKCGFTTSTEALEVKTLEQAEAPPIEIVTSTDAEQAKVKETCPSCGNPEAIRSVSFVSGEHAGVRQERSMERFICTKCGHAWTQG
jgi:DNA-directed RNA polymerase subunit M/transcription elongation factor TFIIS